MSKPINGISPGEWAKHLRPYSKRLFWKQMRANPIVPTNAYDNIPAGLDEDNDKPSKKNGSRRFGIKTTYCSSWLAGRSFSYDTWYATEKARDTAYECKSKKEASTDLRFRNKLEKVQR